MSAPASAQSLIGADPVELNAIVTAWDDIPNVEVVDGPEFPVSGDATTKAEPFYASIERSNAAGRRKLRQVLDATRAAKDKAGRDQRARRASNPT